MSQSQTQSSVIDDSFSDGSGSGTGTGEIMLFGVRVKVDPMRKSVSMNNLSQYIQPVIHHESSNNNIDVSAAVAIAADTGYASADDAGRNHAGGGRERKRGVPWTEDEHKLFLLGLQNVGKGDWRGISRNFVKTRTPTQVASHAQKYFLRRSNLNRRRRRSSLFDITTDSIAVTPMSTEEEHVHEDNKGQAVKQPSMPSSQHISPINGFTTATYPVTAGPGLQPVQLQNPAQVMNFNNDNQVSSGSTLLVHPVPVSPASNLSTRTDLNLNLTYETEPSLVSLNLSLSDQSSERRSSSYQVISGFNNRDSMIRVA
ncbi:transcription factor MYB1R1-like [Rutidosis leptorrhynchoides]|uniref:transcription factor MYB1R1-like n=1 Tax=Rutidosis leptorrhynchoides TaxID=125765 RepID=UPI003A98EBA9